MGKLRYLWRLILIISLIQLIIGCSPKPERIDLFNLKWEKVRNNPIIKPGNHRWDHEQIFVGSVLKQNEKYFMWYYGKNMKERTLQIGLKESIDGIEWKDPTMMPVLTPGDKTEWDGTGVSKPCVKVENNVLKMWYIGERKVGERLIPQIGIATSENGSKWIKSDNNPIFDLRTHNLRWASFLRYFWIIKDNNNYKMWFSAVGEKSYKNVESIGYAYSKDGINWEVHPRPVLERDTSSVWEDFYVSNPMVLRQDSVYYMFYGGLGRYGYLFKESIGIAKSADGIHWQKYSGNPIVYYTEKSQAWDREFVTNPRVLPVNESRYYLWYVGADKKNTREEFGTYQIGLSIGKY